MATDDGRYRIAETFDRGHLARTKSRALEGIVAAETEVVRDMGPGFIAMARGSLADLPLRRYVFVVARLP